MIVLKETFDDHAIQHVADNLRHGDRLALELYHPGRPVVDILRQSIEISDQVYAVHAKEGDRNPIGFCGLAVPPEPDRGYTWFLSTDDVASCGKSVSLVAKALTDFWLQEYSLLMNIIPVWDKRTISWLQYIGFEVTHQSFRFDPDDPLTESVFFYKVNA